MSKLILNVAKSLDGYLARIDGSVDFLGTEFTEEQTKSFNEFLDSIDVIIMGSASYDKMIELGGNTFKDKFIYVMTSQQYADEDNTEFLEADAFEVLSKAQTKSEKNIWLFGGAKTIQQFTDKNFVDEYIITIVPHLTGTGIPLFLFSDQETKLELKKTEVIDGNVTLTYTKK